MTLDDDTLDELTAEAINIARSAGQRILEIYDTAFEVTEKADETPLTNADLAANQLIIDALSALTPDIPILTEESADIPFSERHRWRLYWLVDPLDGTREFIKRNGEFSVNIALIRYRSPIIGVVYAPVMDLMYYARHHAGAWKQRGTEPPVQIRVRSAPDDDHITVARSRAPKTGPKLESFLRKLGVHREVSMGSALKSCLVAEGLADVYARLGPTSEWDTGAAQCIVEEAGGRIVDTRRRNLRYNTKDSLLNPHFLVFGDNDRDWVKYLEADSVEDSTVVIPASQLANGDPSLSQ